MDVLKFADVCAVGDALGLASIPHCCQTKGVNPMEDPAVSKSFHEWLKEGEALYESAYKQYQAIEAQLEDLDRQLAEKKTEVNQIAEIIGKPPVEGSRRLTAQIIEPD